MTDFPARSSTMWCVVLLAALAAAPLAAQADPVAEGSRLYREGVAAYRSGDYSTAIDRLKTANLRRPNHPAYVYALGAVAARGGDTALALATIERYASLGLTAPIEADSDFVALRGSRRFTNAATRIAENGTPLGRSVRAIDIAAPDFFAEGVGYDPGGRTWYVSSIRHRKVVRVDADGKVADFVPSAAHGLGAATGVAVDAKRGHLYVASTAIPQMIGYEAADSGRSTLFRFDLRTGRLLARLDAPASGAPHWFGDVVVSPSGDVFVSDSKAPEIYWVRNGGDSLELFLRSPAIRSAQGIAPSADGKTLYVADYARGVFRVDVTSRTATLLDVSDSVTAIGIDGLYAHGGALIGIQNGVNPMRVVRLSLDRDGRRIERLEVIDRGSAAGGEPTLGVIVGSDLYYVGNSQWGSYDDAGKLKANAKLEPTVVLRAPL